MEEHRQDEQTSWVSNGVLEPKEHYGIRVTLDAWEVNKVMIPTNTPILRQKGKAKAKLLGARHSP